MKTMNLLNLVFLFALVNIYQAKHHHRHHHHKLRQHDSFLQQKTENNSLVASETASRRDNLGFLNIFHNNKAQFKKLFARTVNKTLNENNDDIVVSFAKNTKRRKNRNKKNALKKRKATKKMEKTRMKPIEYVARNELEEDDYNDNDEDSYNGDEENNSKIQQQQRQQKQHQQKEYQTQHKERNHSGQKQPQQKYYQDKKGQQLQQNKFHPQQKIQPLPKQKLKQIKRVENKQQIEDETEEFEADESQTKLYDLPDDNINLERPHVPLVPHFERSKNKLTKLNVKFNDFNLEGLTKDLDKTILESTGSGSADYNPDGSAAENETSSSGENTSIENVTLNSKAKMVPPVKPQSSISTDQASHAHNNAAGTQYPNFPVPPMIPIPLFYNSGDEEGSASSGMTDVKPSKEIHEGESGLGEILTPAAKHETASGDWVDRMLSDQSKAFGFDEDEDKVNDEDEIEEKHALKIEKLAQFPEFDKSHLLNNLQSFPMNKALHHQKQHEQMQQKVLQQNDRLQSKFAQQMKKVPSYQSVSYDYPNFYYKPLNYYQSIAKQLQVQKQFAAAQYLKKKMSENNMCVVGCDLSCSPKCSPLCCASRAAVSKFNEKDIKIAHSAAEEAKTDMATLQREIDLGKKPASINPEDVDNTLQQQVTPQQNAKISPSAMNSLAELQMPNSQLNLMQQQQQQQQQQLQQQQPLVSQYPELGLFQVPQQTNPEAVQPQIQDNSQQYANPIDQKPNVYQSVSSPQIPQQQPFYGENYFNNQAAAPPESKNQIQATVDHDLEATMKNLPQGNLVPLPDMMIDNSNPSSEFKSSNPQSIEPQINSNNAASPYSSTNQALSLSAFQPQMQYANPLSTPLGTGIQSEDTDQRNTVNQQKQQQLVGAVQNSALPTVSQQQQSSTTPAQSTKPPVILPSDILGPSSIEAKEDFLSKVREPSMSDVLESKDDVADKPVSYPNPLIKLQGPKPGNFAFKPIQPILLKMPLVPNSSLNKNINVNNNNNNNCINTCEHSCAPYCSNYCCGIANRRELIAKHHNI